MDSFMHHGSPGTARRYPFFVRRDLDGFFGLLVDNLVQLIVIIELGGVGRLPDRSPVRAGRRMVAGDGCVVVLRRHPRLESQQRIK